MKGDPLRTQRFHLPRRPRGSSLFAVFLLVLPSFLRLMDLTAAPIGTVQVDVQVLLASNQTRVPPDPRLASLTAQLRTALPYSSFQLVVAPGGRVALGQSWRTELPGGDRVLELTPTANDRGAIRIRALVVQTRIVQGRSVSETLVNTTLRLQCGSAPVVIGGPAYQDGVLVIVISACAS